MKRKYIAMLAAAFVLAQPLSAYAANSPSSRPVISRGGGGGSSSSKGGSYRPMTSGDVATVAGTTGTIGGSTVVGNAVVNIVTDYSKTGLSTATIETINTINAGTTPLYRAIGTTNVVGYSALAPVQVMAVADMTTGQATTASLPMYVPNLVQGLGDVQVLFYNGTTKSWDLMAPTAIDYATKQITVNVASGTPFTVVYKK